MTTMPTFPHANQLDLDSARARYAGGMMVTVTRTACGTVADWAFVTVARINGRACERAPGRRVRFMSADESNPLVRFALALLDASYSGYVYAPTQSRLMGVYILSPARCTAPRKDGTACGDVLSTPRSIAEGRGPTCGGRYAASAERAEARRAIARAAWAGVLPVKASETTTSAPACNGTCDPMTTCPTCG